MNNCFGQAARHNFYCFIQFKLIIIIMKQNSDITSDETAQMAVFEARRWLQCQMPAAVISERALSGAGIQLFCTNLSIKVAMNYSTDCNGELSQKLLQFRWELRAQKSRNCIWTQSLFEKKESDL